jgi:hypothetical protein
MSKRYEAGREAERQEQAGEQGESCAMAREVLHRLLHFAAASLSAAELRHRVTVRRVISR